MTFTLKQKMVIPLLASIIISALVASPFIYQKMVSLKTQFVYDLVIGKKGEIERAVDMAAGKAQEKAAMFIKMAAVLEAYELAHTGNINNEADAAAQQARDMLRRNLKPALDGFQAASGEKLKLHFHLPNGRSLVRLWRDKQTKRDGKWVDVSDDISNFRKTVLKVNRTGKPVSGIELGRGGFVVRGLAPIKSGEGKQLGSAEVLVDFKPIFQAAAAEDQELLLYMNADQLPITKRLQDSGKYPVLDNRFVLVAGTKAGEVEKMITSDFLDRGKQGLIIEIFGSRALAAFPVKDFQNKQIGIMALHFNIKTVYAGIRSVFMILAATMAAMLLLIMAVNYIALLKAVIRPVANISLNLRSNANQVSSSSGEISSTSQTLAQGASEAAASIEEISASVEEVSSMTRQNAENTGEADALMKKSGEMTMNANESMQQLTESMVDITAGSEETFKIIKTIDEIAFQTNLLALNAAVEAARAGEAGAGFAVVADEVRNLAMRASEAAKNTSELIENTVTKIKQGSKLMTKADEVFRGVSESSDKVAQLVSEIAVASKEQANGIEQISGSLSELDGLTQQNAASAEESAAASEQLNAMALQMDQRARELATLIGENEFNINIPEKKRPRQLLQ